MMTEREALNLLMEYRIWLSESPIIDRKFNKLIESLGIAIFDMVLQIPTEPEVDDKTDNWTCPNCFDEYSDMERHKFCPNCGQKIAIDWSKEE